jgi:HEAT repeat protein
MTSWILVLALCAVPDAPRPVATLLEQIRLPEDQLSRSTREKAMVELASHNTLEAAQLVAGFLEDEALRPLAARSLHKFTNPATAPAFLPVLRKPSDENRALAARVLGRVGGDDTVTPLMLAARGGGEKSRAVALEAAMQVAAERGAPASVKLVVAAIDDKELGDNVRDGLYKFRQAAHAPLLVHLLKHPRPEVRERACSVVGRLKNPDVVDAFLAALQDKAEAVQRCAMEELPAMTTAERSMDVGRALVPLLAHEKYGSAAARNAGKLRNPKVGNLLIPSLASKKVEVRKAVVEALASLGCQEAADALAARIPLEQESYVHNALLVALAQLTDKEEHVALLLKSIDDKTPYSPGPRLVRSFRNPAVAPHLFVLLKHPNPFVRREVAYALGELANPAAAVVLMDAVERDDDGGTQLASAEALSLVASPENLPRLVKLTQNHPGNGRVTYALQKCLVAVDRTDGFQALTALVKQGNPLGRELVNQLASHPHPRDEAVFQLVLTQKDVNFRREGVFGLASMHSTSARDVLCRLITTDPDNGIRSAAAGGLRNFHDEAAVDCLIAALQKSTREKEPSYHEELLRALKEATGQDLPPDPAAWKAWRKSGMGLGAGPESMIAALSHQDDSVRNLAAINLLKHKETHAQALPTVLRRLEEERRIDIRVSLTELAGKANNPAAIDVLVKRLEQKPDDLRERVALARALDDLGDARGTLGLLEDLDSPSADVRWKAVEALSQVTGEPPRPNPAWWKEWWKTHGERYRRATP